MDKEGCCGCGCKKDNKDQEPDVCIDMVSTRLGWKDYFGGFKARWGINRDNYKVAPGLYAVGNPDKGSNVFVTANYKLTFDVLRKNLVGVDGWLLVLDTKGVNVWCAAGKGTFGTEELIERIEKSGLSRVVDHKKIIVPQLGAVGVSACEVKSATGFEVIYGPVRACDINLFLDNGLKSDGVMRQAKFTFYDRLVVVPMEMVIALKYFLVAAVIVLLVAGLRIEDKVFVINFKDCIFGLSALVGAFISGTILGPLMLPFLPGRSFSFKGFFMGLITAGFLADLFGVPIKNIEFIGMSLVVIAASSFFTMNFTGTSTYTSLSGVMKDMRVGMPLQAVAMTLGVVLYVIAKFL
jgi:hypothetical protein